MKNDIDAATIDAARAALRDVPAKQPDKLSKRDAVIALRKEIDAMRRKGYGWSDISAKLGEVGIHVAAASLRSYMTDAKPSKKPATTGTPDPGTPSAPGDMTGIPV